MIQWRGAKNPYHPTESTVPKQSLFSMPELLPKFLGPQLLEIQTCFWNSSDSSNGVSQSCFNMSKTDSNKIFQDVQTMFNILKIPKMFHHISDVPRYPNNTPIKSKCLKHATFQLCLLSPKMFQIIFQYAQILPGQLVIIFHDFPTWHMAELCSKSHQLVTMIFVSSGSFFPKKKWVPDFLKRFPTIKPQDFPTIKPPYVFGFKMFYSSLYDFSAARSKVSQGFLS